MSWDARHDQINALARGYGITGAGQFYAYPLESAVRMSDNGIDAHSAIMFALAKQAAAGDEFAARALAEALRRRMTK